jgi:hypothetical protein
MSSSLMRFLPITLAVLLSACNKPHEPADPALPPAPVPTTAAAGPMSAAHAAAIVGGDADAHGCKPSAGYSWSQVQEKCLRIFEAGIRLNPMGADEKSTQVAYVIFDKAQARAELFLPGEKNAVILAGRGEEGAQSWEAGDLKLIPWKGYVLQKNGQAIYGGDQGVMTP